MSEATAWVALAKQERAAHRKAWGPIKEKKSYKPKRTANPKRLALIAEMISEGFSNSMIAEELGVSKPCISYWKNKYKLKGRNDNGE